jgi:hypothetical protein
MTTKELNSVKSLWLNKDIRFLHTDKDGYAVVFNESKYKEKLNTLLESGVYEHLPKDPTAKVERKVQKLLSKHKTPLPIKLNKIQVDSVPQQTSASIWSSQYPQTEYSSGSRCYVLAGFLRKTLSPLAGKSESFVKNWGHFLQSLKHVNFKSSNILRYL